MVDIMATGGKVLGEQLTLECECRRRIATREQATTRREECKQPISLRRAPVDLPNARDVEHCGDKLVKHVLARGLAQEGVGVAHVVDGARRDEEAPEEVGGDAQHLRCHLPPTWHRRCACE